MLSWLKFLVADSSTCAWLLQLQVLLPGLEVLCWLQLQNDRASDDGGVLNPTNWPGAGAGDISSRGHKPQTISVLGPEGTGTLSEEVYLVWLLVFLVCSGSHCSFVLGLWYNAGHQAHRAIGGVPQLHT